MRLFVALDIPKEIRERIKTYMSLLQREVPGVKWVRPEGLHVTLKFIGNTDKMEAIKRELQSVKSVPLEVRFRGAGFFTPRSPRVFWIGVEGLQIAAFAKDIDARLQSIEIPAEEREFNPHLTLAREGSGHPRGDTKDRNKPLMYALRDKIVSSKEWSQPEFGTITAAEFFLYRSETKPEGAVYTKLAGFALKGLDAD